MAHFKLRWKAQGAHVYVRVFVAEHSSTAHAKCGELTMLEHEWEAFLRCFQDKGSDRVLVIPEEQ